jgi:hypothetical protein
MALHKVAFVLLVVGGLNWLLFGLFGWELGAKLLGGNDTTLSMIVYVLVGLSAIYEIATHKSNCRGCSAGGM